MNDEELKKILEDPKKILDFFRIFHQILHLMDAQENRKKPGIEKMGLSDSLDVQVSHSNKLQEVKQ